MVKDQFARINPVVADSEIIAGEGIARNNTTCGKASLGRALDTGDGGDHRCETGSGGGYPAEYARYACGRTCRGLRKTEGDVGDRLRHNSRYLRPGVFQVL